MNKPFRIILIIFILELFVVASLGFVFQNKLQTVEDQIASGQITSISIYLSKMVIYPLKKMIESKEKRVTAEDAEIKKRLLHMTEGIIAFNIDGKIDLINPAAKRLLNISPEDYTFEDVFNKFNLDINMEKMIYLEVKL